MVGALVYAALAIGSGMDRLAVARPRLANHVPTWFAADALQISGAGDLSRNPRAALEHAEWLVARAPIEPSSSALLGAARHAMGDDAGADRAFRVSGQLGWRVPLTQSFLLGAALDAGDLPVAAQRLDALLRLQPHLLNIPAVLAPFEQDDTARAALVERLVTRPPWLGWYTGELLPTPADALARRVPSLMMLGDRGIKLGCEAIAPAVRELAGAGLAAQAEALRRRHCSGRAH